MRLKRFLLRYFPPGMNTNVEMGLMGILLCNPTIACSDSTVLLWHGVVLLWCRSIQPVPSLVGVCVFVVCTVA